MDAAGMVVGRTWEICVEDDLDPTTEDIVLFCTAVCVRTVNRPRRPGGVDNGEGRVGPGNSIPG
ncbi:hypothetical protein ATP06_0236175 [Amycolatopsis regifaucium]|uniref:Uncharacterized protein n=2 Tax=Amycolatopsis regifaucium TaxID=546365 RepID=A0ABX3DGE3_9PSEU|nr:hypothetical protein ATP06_0236175 [Amycolatopsis regifaucium]